MQSPPPLSSLRRPSTRQISLTSLAGISVWQTLTLARVQPGLAPVLPPPLPQLCSVGRTSSGDWGLSLPAKYYSGDSSTVCIAKNTLQLLGWRKPAVVCVITQSLRSKFRLQKTLRDSRGNGSTTRWYYSIIHITRYTWILETFIIISDAIHAMWRYDYRASHEDQTLVLSLF